VYASRVKAASHDQVMPHENLYPGQLPIPSLELRSRTQLIDPAARQCRRIALRSRLSGGEPRSRHVLHAIDGRAPSGRDLQQPRLHRLGLFRTLGAGAAPPRVAAADQHLSASRTARRARTAALGGDHPMHGLQSTTAERPSLVCREGVSGSLASGALQSALLP
jgi:hypothetical protein